MVGCFGGFFFVCKRLLGWLGEKCKVQIIKKINNNAALGLDGSGTEVVVLGKGIGFPDMPYELTDYNAIQRTFYDMDPRYVQMAAGIPSAVLEASADIAEQAELELECELSPNLPFTLADHLNFAVERVKRGSPWPPLCPMTCATSIPKKRLWGKRRWISWNSIPAPACPPMRPSMWRCT